VSTDVPLLRLGSATMDSATVVQWLVVVGDRVAQDQPLVEVETDKSVVEVTAPIAGTVTELVVPEGSVVPVGSVLARIAHVSESASVQLVTAPSSPGLSPTAWPVAPTGSDAEGVSGPAVSPGRLRATPAARRRAIDLGVELGSLIGSGPDGRVEVADVYLAASGPSQTTRRGRAGDSLQGLSNIRRRTAEKMAASSREVAAVTLSRHVDATALEELVTGLKRLAQAPAPGVTDLVVAAVARALAARPELNVSLGSEGLVRHHDVNVGWAVQNERGLVVPVISGADRLALAALARVRRAMTDRALAGGLHPQDMVDGRITVSNLGPQGVDIFTPIVNLPECMVLGVGRIASAVLPWNGGIALRRGCWISLTFDHRLVDGAPAGGFLSEVVSLLEDPLALLVPPAEG